MTKYIKANVSIHAEIQTVVCTIRRMRDYALIHVRMKTVVCTMKYMKVNVFIRAEIENAENIIRYT